MDIMLNLNSGELLFSSSDSKRIHEISRLLKKGQIRKIAPKIFTTNFEEDAEIIIKRNILQILGTLYPEAILSHRSAFEFKPTKSNLIFVTYKYTKRIKLPGVIISFLEGSRPIEGDNRFIGDLFVSQKARAFLENMQISKKLGQDSKTLALPDIEEKLEQILFVHGEDGLNDLRDRARKLSKILNFKKEFEHLNTIIGALLSTKPIVNLKSPAAIARIMGEPYDKKRIELFEILLIELQNSEYKHRQEKNKSTKSFRNFAFFESYFSNFIEGTKFTIEEAKKIIETQTPIPKRTDDSHDILGTYQISANRIEMSVIPNTGEELLNILKDRHSVLMKARPDKNPGQFKEKNNQAGNTLFVEYKLVKGTLKKGFELFRVLENPFSRASFMMFMISEVHPFDDGNGRIARIMMNAELVNKRVSKIIIPNVYREDYILSLRKLSREKEPSVYIDMLRKAYEFSSNVYFEEFDEMYEYLIKCNCFNESDEGKVLKIIDRD